MSQCFAVLDHPPCHCLNSGDQEVNLSIRRHIKAQAKLRIVQHGVDIRRGCISPNRPLEMGERAMKPLLLQWLGSGCVGK